MNPFKKASKSPRLGVKQYSVQDVADANKRYYEKFPEQKEDAAMIKKAMQNPGDEIVKEVEREKEMQMKVAKEMKIEVEIS